MTPNMSPENSNSAAAAETRVDLASLFCMVGRHGPAMGLALIAAASLLLVAVIVYRTVRWTRRRKATTTSADKTTATAGDGDSGSPVNRPRHEPNTEEPRSSSSSSSVESTDGVQSGMKEEGDPKVRHRHVAATPAARPLYYCSSPSPASDIQMTGDKHAASDHTDTMTVEQDSHKEAPKAFEGEDRRKDEKTKQEKEYFQCVSSSQVIFDPPMLCVNDNVVNDGRQQDNKAAPEIINGTECNSEDQSDSLDHSERSCNHAFPEEEPCGVQQRVSRQETCPSKFVLNLSSSQQDEATPPVLDSDEGCEETGKDLGDDQAAKFDTRPPKTCQTEQEEEHGLVDQDECVILTEADQVKEKKTTFDDSDSPSVELKPSHFNEPIEVDHLEEVSGLEGYPDVSVDLQPLQSGVEELATSLDKETDLTIPDSYLPSNEKELKYEKKETAAEESSDLNVPPSYKDQTVNGGPDSSETVNAPLTGEETSCSPLPSVCQEPKSDRKEIIETFTETQIPVTNAGVNIVMSLEMSDPDMWTLSQNQESDQIQNKDDPPVVAQDLIPPFSQIKLQPFEQSELSVNINNNIPSPGVGEESGISSLAVSPDVQDSVNDFGMIVDDMVDCDPESEETTKAQNSLFANDIVLSVTGVTLRHTHDSFAINEDVFGHEIECNYHSTLEQFMMQIAGKGLTSADEPKKLSDLKGGTFEVMEIKEKKKVIRITKKTETGAENEMEELNEKTEISIMEATMDNNEWIMDTNYQFPSWMSPYIAPTAQDHTKTRQRPTEDATDGVCRVQPISQNINVTFRIHYVTHSPNQMVAVTGNQQELGNWKKYLLMERAKDGLWTTVVSLPTESHVEWKFVVVDSGEVCRWEECDNRLLDTGCGDDLTVHKLWGVL